MAMDYHYLNWPNRVWSVMNRGKVIRHVGERHIVDPVFVVRPSGQRRVRATGHKNVHAFVKGKGHPLKVECFHRGLTIVHGHLREAAHMKRWGWLEVSYNPKVEKLRGWSYKNMYDTAPFFIVEDGTPVYGAKEAVLTADCRLFASKLTTKNPHQQMN